MLHEDHVFKRGRPTLIIWPPPLYFAGPQAQFLGDLLVSKSWYIPRGCAAILAKVPAVLMVSEFHLIIPDAFLKYKHRLGFHIQYRL